MKNKRWSAASNRPEETDPYLIASRRQMNKSLSSFKKLSAISSAEKELR